MVAIALACWKKTSWYLSNVRDNLVCR